eukprot:GEMP01001482.1.p1 GENE.GEMP01001482.1~~GEMP01001482.1.p1  ORF type:complete len:630 (+),score=205.80 GEMP01001482.1:94-1983(+)
MKSDVKVNWVIVSDDGEIVTDCETTKDVRAKICDKRECFWSDVVLFDGKYNLVNDNQPAPENIICMFKPKVTYDAERWTLCLQTHAAGDDKNGVERAVRLMKEQEGTDVDKILTGVLTKCLADASACAILIDCGASTSDIISANTSLGDENTPAMLRDIATALSTVATAADKKALAVECVMDLVDGISVFLAADVVEHADALFEHGVLASVIKLLDHENSRLREKATSILLTVSQKASSQRKDALVQVSFFSYLAGALKNGMTDPDLFKLSIKMFSKSSARMRSAIDSGFTSEMLTLATSDNTDVVPIASDTYEAIVTNANKQMLTEFSREGAVGTLLALLKADDLWSERADGHPFTSAVKALCVFAKKLSDDGTLTNSVALKEIEKADVLESLLAHTMPHVVTAATQLKALFDKRAAERKLADELAGNNVEVAEAAESKACPSPPPAAISPPAAKAVTRTREEEEETAQKEEEDVAVKSPNTASSDEAQSHASAEGEEAAAAEQKDVQLGEVQNSVRQRGGKGNTKALQKQGTISRGQRKKRNKTQQEEALEEQESKPKEQPAEKENNTMLVIAQYMAFLLNFISKILGDIVEVGARGFCSLADAIAPICDVCPKKAKGGRAARKTSK